MNALDLAAHATDVARGDLPPAERLALLGDYLMLKIASHQAELTVCFREVQSLTGERHREVISATDGEAIRSSAI